MIKLRIIQLALILAIRPVIAQSGSDSLILALPSISDENTLMKSYYQLLFELSYEDPDSAITFGLKAEALAGEIQNFETQVEVQTSMGYTYEIMGDGEKSFEYYKKGYLNAMAIDYIKGQIDGLLGAGSAKRILGELDSSIYYYTEGMNLAQANDKELHFADANNNLGNVYLDRDQYEKALEHYLVCARILPDDNRVKSIVTINIGLVHYELRNLELAKEYFEKGIALADGINENWLKAYNIQKLGMIAKEQKAYDEALSYYHQSKDIYQQLDNRRQELIINTNIGNIYLEQGELSDAIRMFQTSLDDIEPSDDETNQGFALIGITRAYLAQDDLTKAQVSVKELISLSKKIQSPTKHAEGMRLLGEILAKKGQFREAYSTQRDLAILQDSIFNTEKSEQILDMEARYENDRKEQEINLLNAEKEITELTLQRQEILRNYLIIIAFVIFILAFVLYNQYKNKARANEKLQELDAIKTRFFTNISHEFRTPLTLIIGPAKSRLSETDEPSEQSFLNLIVRNAERLLQLINQLLDLAKLDASHMKLVLKKEDIHQYLRDITSSFESLATEKEIAYQIEIPDQASIIHFDTDKLYKIVVNLLSNAFKFTPKNGRVTFKCISESNQLTIIVSDSGKGIKEELIKNLFTRFHQLEADTHEGSGIGLALTKELVELHNGEISVASEEGKGTTFTVTIPTISSAYSPIDFIQDDQSVKKSAIPPARDITSNDQEFLPTEQESAPILLIVEDNIDVRNYISKVFNDSYQIKTAENGEEGLKAALKLVPDLIISDLMMPKMDGVGLCKQLKTDERTSHIPVILLTAKASIESKIEGLHTGADDYLTKPFNQDELVARVSNLIEQRSKLRKLFGSSLTLEPTMISITPPDEVFLTKAKTIVEEHMNDFDFTVEQFQQLIGMSRMQLHRKLKALTNTSTSEFIRTIRLQRAAQILQTKGVNVSEAAYSAGFNNLSYFAKCFKEHFGMNPSDYISKQAVDS